HADGAWECDLRDARLALGLDTLITGDPGWRDLRPHEPELRAYLVARLVLAGDGLPCPLTLAPTPMEWDAKQNVVRFRLTRGCPHAPARFEFHSEGMFDLDSTYRAYCWVQDARATSVGALRTHLRSATFAVQQFHFFSALIEFVADGVGELRRRLDTVLLVV